MEILSLQNRHQVYRLRKKYEKTKDSFPAENDEKPGAKRWTEREV